MKLKITPFDEKYSKEVLELQPLIVKEVPGFEPDFEKITNFKEVNKNLILIALAGNKLAGYLRGRIRRQEAEIITLYIKKEFRHQGIGKKLINKFIKGMKRRKIKEVQLTAPTEKALKFYKKLGFKTK